MNIGAHWHHPNESYKRSCRLMMKCAVDERQKNVYRVQSWIECLCHIHFSLYSSLRVLFIGWYEDNWYEVNLEAENITCTREQMKIAAEGHLTTEAIMWNQNVHEKTISGMSSGDFRYVAIIMNTFLAHKFLPYFSSLCFHHFEVDVFFFVHCFLLYSRVRKY